MGHTQPVTGSLLPDKNDDENQRGLDWHGMRHTHENKYVSGNKSKTYFGCLDVNGSKI
jgi:hypothetical protein